MDKIVIGIPVYGAQPRLFWQALARECSQLYKQDIELVDIYCAESMMTDVNRNSIVESFLKSDAEWLKWLDADNVDKLYSIRRLLDTKKALVTGTYVMRQKEANPVVYMKGKDGEYRQLSNFIPGQIIPVDGAGLGGLLIHRSVFEDIQKMYRMFDLWPGGGVELVHKDDVIGNVNDGDLDPMDWKVVNGVQHRRLRMPKKDKPFAYFLLKDGRTEDLGFFELTAGAGHQLWCDTGVEIGHIGDRVYTTQDWKDWNNKL